MEVVYGFSGRKVADTVQQFLIVQQFCIGSRIKAIEYVKLDYGTLVESRGPRTSS